MQIYTKNVISMKNITNTKLNKLYSNSILILGIIEDIEINKVKSSHFIHRSNDDKDLCDSINQKGLLQPIIVRPINDYFEIVAGNRRYNACKKLGWKKIICHIVELNDKESYEISLIENIQRKNLDPIEEAQSYKTYVLTHGWGGISELASKIGKSIAYIDKKIKLLELPVDILESILESEISITAAEELIPLNDGKKQSNLADLIIKKKLSSRAIRSMVQGMKNDLISYDDYYGLTNDSIYMDEIDKHTRKVFDKSITILKITAQKLGLLIAEIEENWIIYEMMKHHKDIIDNEINILIKEKKKL